MSLIRSEPALVAALIQTVLAACVVFGVDLTPGQVAAVLAVTGAVLAIIVRSKVSPVPT